MAPFGRGYVYPENGELHEIDFTFDGQKLTARCTCPNCSRGRRCRHIDLFMSTPPISEVVGYPLVVERMPFECQSFTCRD